MKNLKKIALLLSVVTVFAISCGGSQQALNSTFDVITDDPTSVPDNPPTQNNNGTPFPEDFVFNTKDISFESPNRWAYHLTIDINKGATLASKTLKYQSQASFESRTSGISNPKGVLSALTFRGESVANKLFIDVSGSIYDALGSAGQRAKVKYDLYIDVESGNYNTGVRTVYIDIYRKR